MVVINLLKALGAWKLGLATLVKEINVFSKVIGHTLLVVSRKKLQCNKDIT